MNKTLLLALAGTLLIGATVFLAAKSAHVKDAPITESVIVAWKKYKATYNKKFSDPDTEAYRMEVFANNLQIIADDKNHNLGVTAFADLTQEEFAETYLTLQVPEQSFKAVKCTTAASSDINWVTEGKVTAVKNQGSCGSCWAFSTTGALESALIVAGKADNTVSLSEQQLVNCSTTNSGCNGGLMDRAFTYIKNNGITSEADYPYTGVKGKCVKQTADLTYLNKYTDVAAGCVSDLKVALNKQPVSIAVDATNWSLYKSGVFSNCGTSLNHGVLLVAYTNNTWLVKNSWGTTWGENGFIQLADGNTCGLANVASYPSV